MPLFPLILVALVVVAAVVFLAVRGGGGRGASLSPRSGGPPTPPGLFTTEAGAPRARMIIASDYTFAALSRSVGLPIVTTGPMVAAGEPEFATWANDRVRVAYHYAPALGLRRLEITGQNPDYFRNDLLNGAYVPTLEGHKVSGLLASQDSRALRLGIAAAEFVGVDGKGRYYEQALVALSAHPDRAIASAAAAAAHACQTEAPPMAAAARAQISARVNAGHDGLFEGIDGTLLSIIQGRRGKVTKQAFERIQIKAHASAKAMFAVAWEHARFTGKTDSFKIEGLVFASGTPTPDARGNLRLATSNDGRYEYVFSPTGLESPSPTVYWRDLHADPATVGVVAGTQGEAAPTLTKFLQFLEYDPSAPPSAAT